MATEKQIKANRRNAKKSTGPKTDEGKQAVSQNALKHGLHSSQVLIADEDPADFNRFSTDLRTELNPKGPVETMLVERVIVLSWRLRRCVRFQSEMCDYLAVSINEHNEEQEADTARIRSVRRDFAYNKVLENLLRHETSLERSLYKTMLELQRLQFIRTQYQSLLVDGRDYSDAEFEAEKQQQPSEQA
ncbi:MAG: hypothetical protein LLF76_09155 [Planctomycetaceae bacterium]|nr:hypothetical protein [Planctomycetaceae bacterium]